MQIDLFCHVIDYFGDAAVLYRLARALMRQDASLKLRFFCTHPQLVQALYPHQHEDNIALYAFEEASNADNRTNVAIEAFGCQLPKAYQLPPLVINLEYLSAEPWIEEYHALESIGMNINGKKFFFFPSFSNRAGGLTHGDFLAKMKIYQQNESLYRQQLISHLNLPSQFMMRPWLLVYLYEIEQATLTSLAQHYALIIISSQKPTITHPWLATRRCSQKHFDQLLILSQIALIRGEDSLSRAVLAGKPFLWQAYRQPENAHFDKLKALHHHLQQLNPQGQHRLWQSLQWQLNEHNTLNMHSLMQLSPHWFELSAKQLRQYSSLEQRLLEFINHHLA